MIDLVPVFRHRYLAAPLLYVRGIDREIIKQEKHNLESAVLLPDASKCNVCETAQCSFPVPVTIPNFSSSYPSHDKKSKLHGSLRRECR
jgi:hypothetical protein